MTLKPFMREVLFPLPVTFISTAGSDGIRNIAPYSCIMPVRVSCWMPLEAAAAADYGILAKKLETRQVTMDEMVHFQVLLDARVKHLMNLSPETLFVVEPIHSGCLDRSLN